MTAVESLQLRQISGAEYETRREIGRGRRLDRAAADRAPGESSEPGEPTATLTLICDEAVAGRTPASHVVAFSSRHGQCRLTDGHLVLAVSANVPPPPEHDDRLTALFESLCFSRLSRTFLFEIGPVQPATPAPGKQDVELTWMAERAGVRAFARAQAPRALWQALCSNASRLPRPAVPRCRNWQVELPVVIASGRFAAATVEQLAPGDLLQFKTVRLHADGTGHMQLGRQMVSYRLVQDERASMTIEAIGSPDNRRITVRMETNAMNEADEFDEFDDDEPAPQDSPTGEEAESEIDLTSFPDPDRTLRKEGALDIRHLEVQLVIELGRLNISIGELEDVQVGSILKVGTPGARTVSVKTAASGDTGQVIALGELVQVNDSLAVQITRVLE